MTKYAVKSKRATKRGQTPRCPKCGKEIHSLIYGEVVRTLGEYSLTGGIESDGCSAETVEEEFACMECGEDLFFNEEDAERFLRGAGDEDAG